MDMFPLSTVHMRRAGMEEHQWMVYGNANSTMECMLSIDIIGHYLLKHFTQSDIFMYVICKSRTFVLNTKRNNWSYLLFVINTNLPLMFILCHVPSTTLTTYMHRRWMLNLLCCCMIAVCNSALQFCTM